MGVRSELLLSIETRIYVYETLCPTTEVKFLCKFKKLGGGGSGRGGGVRVDVM